MKSNLRLLVVSVAVLGTALPQFPLSAPAQEQPPLAAGPAPTGLPPAGAPPADAPQGAPLRTPAELDALLGPIALYPDPLLAQILPAATAPQDVVLAARFVASGKDVALIDQQPWEESVKALARYPDVLKMMDEKLDWTSDLGDAFVAQPEDVFASVQRLRGQAEAMGNLKTSPQQTIVQENQIIQIVPADPQVIYVPQYSPTVIYTQPPPDPTVPLLAFGAGLAMGIWIHNEVDWHHHGVYYHNDGWHGGGYGGGGNSVNINNSNNINIGNGNGNGSAWKPQNRPGNNGNRPGAGNGANRPGAGNGANRPGAGNGANRPGAGTGAGGSNRPGAGNGAGAGNNRPGAGTGAGGNKPGLGGANGGAGGNKKPAFGGGAQTRPAGGATQRPAAGGGKSNPFSREASKPNQSGGRGALGGGRQGGGAAASRPAAAQRPSGGGGGARAGGGGGGGGAARAGGGGAGGGGGRAGR